jgi:hypothetical protein
MDMVEIILDLKRLWDLLRNHPTVKDVLSVVSDLLDKIAGLLPDELPFREHMAQAPALPTEPIAALGLLIETLEDPARKSALGLSFDWQSLIVAVLDIVGRWISTR